MLAVALVALVCGLCAASPARASGAAPFRQLMVLSDPSQRLTGFETDGIRFALIYDRGVYEAPLVLDTFRARRFRPGPPLPACEFRVPAPACWCGRAQARAGGGR